MKKRKFAIGAGHGINTAGRRCWKSLDPNETREWALNAETVEYVVEALNKQGNVEVLRVDDPTGKEDVYKGMRCNLVNNFESNLYISVHHNGGINGGIGGGASAFYYSNNPARLGQAEELYHAIVNETGLVGNRSTPVQKNNLWVLRDTKCPSFLVELGFMDSKTDVPIIITDSHSRQAAQGICNFVNKYFGLPQVDIFAEITPPTPEEEHDKKVLYTVQMGAFSSKENAERLQNVLKEDGHDTYLTEKEIN